MCTTKGEKLINEGKKRKKKDIIILALFHTHTNKQLHARICDVIVLYNTFLKSAQKEKVNCILIIKATHTHTQLDVRKYDR